MSPTRRERTPCPHQHPDGGSVQLSDRVVSSRVAVERARRPIVHIGHTRPYKCELCNSSFLYRKDVVLHMNHKHQSRSDFKGYACTLPGCTKRYFGRKDNLRRHMRSVHEVSDEDTLTSAVRDAEAEAEVQRSLGADVDHSSRSRSQDSSHLDDHDPANAPTYADFSSRIQNSPLEGNTPAIHSSLPQAHARLEDQETSVVGMDMGLPDLMHGNEPTNIASPSAISKRAQPDCSSPHAPDSAAEDRASRPSKLSKSVRSNEVRFACPFYKHDPATYGEWRVCGNPPGFPDVNRMKEHVYRGHRAPVHCPRCGEEFPTDDALNAHYRSDIPCQRISFIKDGCDESKILQLRDRRVFTQLASQEERWACVYRILFPDVRPEDVPDPYISQDHGHHVNQLTERRRIAQEMEEAVSQALTRELSVYEDAIRNHIKDTIHKALNETAERPRSHSKILSTNIELEPLQPTIANSGSERSEWSIGSSALDTNSIGSVPEAYALPSTVKGVTAIAQHASQFNPCDSLSFHPELFFDK